MTTKQKLTSITFAAVAALALAPQPTYAQG
jgi:hypothetical protein